VSEEANPSGDQAHPSGERRALAAIRASGLDFEVSRHGPVRSLAEAAAVRGLEPSQIIKTLVVRRADQDFVLVLVPGGRAISWPKLRAVLSANRLSMPDAAGARAATGYERGTITPFGSTTSWPVIADDRVPGQVVSIGAGGQGVAFTVDGSALIATLAAITADVTEPE